MGGGERGEGALMAFTQPNGVYSYKVQGIALLELHSSNNVFRLSQSKFNILFLFAINTGFNKNLFKIEIM